MSAGPIFANNLAAEREARGIAAADELARSADIEPSLYAMIEAGEILPTQAEATRLAAVLGVKRSRLYPIGLNGAIGGDGEGGTYEVSLDQVAFYRELRDPTRLLVSRDEMAWLERAAEPDGEYDVFVNLSCGTQMHPHLMLDAVAVLRTLGVNFAAGAGTDFCCGGYFRIHHSERSGVHVAEKSVRPALARGASTHVSWCTQCVNNFTAVSNRRVAEGGEATPLREVQFLDFLAERLEELGDAVPWVRSVDRKVVVHGHPRESPVVSEAVHNVTRVLQLVPGVEVVGLMERTFMDDFCYTGDQPGYPTTPEEMQAKRHEIAAIARSNGADTVSPQHQDCSRIWAPFASVDMAVRNAVSIVAEGLGCDHPDRVEAAYLLGDPDAVVEQTRPIWSSWGLTEDQAREIAHREYKPVATAKVVGCSCGRGACGREVVDIDVLQGIDWESAVAIAASGKGSS